MFKYKIKCYINRIPDSYKLLEDIEKARLYHKKHGVDWELTFVNTDVRGYKTMFNASKDNWFLDGAEKLVTLDENFDAIMFCFDQAEFLPAKNTPTGSTKLVSIRPNVAIPFMTIGCYSVNHELGIQWVECAHEPMHSYTQNTSLENKLVIDVMDSYRENDNPDSLTGNFSQQWGLLASWIASKTLETPLVATLTRLYDYGRETVGKLVVDDGGFMCNTLELGWRENQNNVSSIPLGKYLVKRTFSPLHLKYSYEIQKVHKRNGIRIDFANFYNQLLGCVALGRGYGNLDLDGLPDILQSRKTVTEFEKYMDKRDFVLEVK